MKWREMRASFFDRRFMHVRDPSVTIRLRLFFEVRLPSTSFGFRSPTTFTTFTVCSVTTDTTNGFVTLVISDP